MSTPDQPAARRGIVARLLWNTAYVLVAFPVTLAAFVVCFAMFCLGGGLAIIWVGLPILVASLRAAGWFADAERCRLRWVFPEIVARPAREPIGPGLLRPLSVKRCWADLGFTFVAWIPATVAFSVVVTWWATVLGGVSYPVWQWALPDDDERLNELLGLGGSLGAELAVYVAVGLVALVLLPVVARAMSLLHAGSTRLLLGPPRVAGAVSIGHDPAGAAQ